MTRRLLWGARVLVCAITLAAGAASATRAQVDAPAPAQVQPRLQDRTRARELYAEGQTLFREGEYAAAQRSFEEAYRILPNPVVLLSIAECQVRSEQYEAAIATFEKYLAERSNAPDAAQVQAQIAAIRAKPSVLSVDSQPPGTPLALTVDGTATGRVTPTELELSAGDHTLEAAAPGFETVRKVVTMRLGARESLALPLTPVAVPLAVAVQPTPVVSDDRRFHASKAMWVATGVAAGGVALGSLLGGLALKQSSNFDAHPKASTADKGERLALFADVGFGIAAAAGATALVLYFTSSDAPDAAVAIAPAVGPGSAGMVGHLRF